MTVTKVSDLVNPQVMADAVSAKLEKGIKFTEFAKVDTTLVGQAGDTITRPKYAYIGPAEDLTEGVAMDPKKMSMTTSQVTIKEVGIAVEPTTKSIEVNIDGTLDEAANQLGLAIADKIEIDYVAALESAVLEHDAEPVSFESILDAVDVFGDESDEEYVLFINPKDYSKLRKESINGNTFLSQDGLAELLGLEAIVRTKRVDEGTAYIQKGEAVEIVYKKTPEINVDDDILKRTVIIACDSLYTVNLYNDAGVVKITSTP